MKDEFCFNCDNLVQNRSNILRYKSSRWFITVRVILIGDAGVKSGIQTKSLITHNGRISYDILFHSVKILKNVSWQFKIILR